MTSYIANKEYEQAYRQLHTYKLPLPGTNKATENDSTDDACAKYLKEILLGTFNDDMDTFNSIAQKAKKDFPTLMNHLENSGETPSEIKDALNQLSSQNNEVIKPLSPRLC